MARDRGGAPRVVGLLAEPQHPAGHHDGNPVRGQVVDQRVRHFGEISWAKEAAARRRISFSCSSSLLRLRNSRSSADSLLVGPGRAPSSVSASLSQRCRQPSEIPTSLAICRNGASPLRATATRSRRNSGGNGGGRVNTLPGRTAPSQVRSQPTRGHPPSCPPPPPTPTPPCSANGCTACASAT